MKNFDVVVMGAAGIDTNVYLYSNEIDFKVEANFSENLDYIGQAGGYAARAYRKLGYKTSYIGYIGNDHQGRFIEEQFRKDGIDVTGLMIDPLGTKRSVNFMYANGKRKNFYDGKGSMQVEADLEICTSIIRNAKLAHLSIVNWTRFLIPILKKEGVAIATDVQDVVDPQDDYRRDYILNSDYLFFSAVNFVDPEPLIETFLGMNSDLKIICGRGGNGCIYADKERFLSYEAVEIDRPVIDTNGAGDSLAAGFLSSYLLEDYSLEDSILRGQIAARYCCSIKGSTDYLIDKQQMQVYYDKFRNQT